MNRSVIAGLLGYGFLRTGPAAEGGSEAVVGFTEPEPTPALVD